MCPPGLRVDTRIAADPSALVLRVSMCRHDLGETFAAPGALVVGFSPRLPALPQLRADALLFLARNAAFLDPLGEVVFIAQIALGGCLNCARAGSILSQPVGDTRQSSMPGCPGHSARSLSGNSLSGSAIVTVKGTSWNRRRIASSTPLRLGLWLPAITSLKAGA